MVTQVVSVFTLLVLLLWGIKRPAFLLAGTFFTYQVGAISGLDWIGSVYVAAAGGIALVRFAIRPVATRLMLGDFAMILLTVFLIASSFWAPYPDDAFAMALQLLLSVAGMYLIARLEPGDAQFFRDFVLALAIAGAVLAICLLAVRVVDGVHQGTRLYITNESASTVGISMALPYVLVAGFVLLFFARKPSQMSIGAVSLAVTGYCSVISATRSVFLAFGVGALIFAFLARRSLHMSRKTANIFAGVLLLPVAIAMVPDGAFENLLSRFSGGVSGVASQRERQQLWADGWSIISEHPFIGGGYGSFDQYSTTSYPHNMLIEITAAGGVIGLGLLLFWLAVTAAHLLRSYRVRPVPAAFLIGLFLAATASMQVSFAFFMARPLFLISALAAAWASQVPQGRRLPARRFHPVGGRHIVGGRG